MLDMHSHILPGVDDGAKTTEDSLKLLEQMCSQNIDVAVATVHFYPDLTVLQEFLEERQRAKKQLDVLTGKDFPVKILLGAEVFYFGGIGKFTGIKKLTIENSNYLLLELLGLKKIDDKVIKDIVSIKEDLGLIPIIAHVERYCKYRGYKKLISAIAEKKALCQINATFDKSRAEIRAVKKLLKAGLIDFVASDCHDPLHRPVNIDTAFAALREISPCETDKIIKKTEKLKKELMSVYEK